MCVYGRTMQRSIWEFVGRRATDERKDDGTKPKFVDLFCGIGGASQGAIEAGYDVTVAVDSCARALDVHKKNRALQSRTLRMC